MTDQPQPIDLDVIEARTNAATVGPWKIEWDTDDVSDVPFPISIGPIGYLEHRGDREVADAEFIAADRTDVPALLAEIRRLRQHIDELQSKVMASSNGQCCCSFDSPGDVCMVHSPTVDRLTAELQQSQQQTADRIAAEIRQYCPDHGSADTCRMDCHCAIADEITRPAAVSAHPCTDPACGPSSFDRAIPPTTGTAEHPVTHNWQPSEVRGIERCTHPGCHARRVPAMDAATHNPAAVSGA